MDEDEDIESEDSDVDEDMEGEGLEDQEDEEGEKEEEFYSVGSEELLQARRDMLSYSMPR